MECHEERNECSLEDEEIIVYVNFDEPIDDYSKEDLVDTKILGLDTDEPILQIGNKVFGGSWNETIGTALFFEETTPVQKRCFFSEKVTKPLKYVGKTTKQLNLKRVFITEKIMPSGTEEVTSSTDLSDNDNEGSCDTENCM